MKYYGNKLNLQHFSLNLQKIPVHLPQLASSKSKVTGIKIPKTAHSVHIKKKKSQIWSVNSCRVHYTFAYQSALDAKQY